MEIVKKTALITNNHFDCLDISFLIFIILNKKGAVDFFTAPLSTNFYLVSGTAFPKLNVSGTLLPAGETLI